MNLRSGFLIIIHRKSAAAAIQAKLLLDIEIYDNINMLC